MRARHTQRARFKGSKVCSNARTTGRMIKKFCKVDGPAETSLAAAMQQFTLSARAYSKILKLSRAIAYLDGAEEIRTEHVAKAMRDCFASFARVLTGICGRERIQLTMPSCRIEFRVRRHQ